jgi:hypothetical protein
MNPLGPIQRLFVVILLYISHLLTFAVKRLRFVGKGIPIEDKVSDFIQIFKTTRIFFLFNILALLVFTVLPQGKDVILIVIEDLSGLNPLSLISLLVGLFGWCIISEFGARYKIYVTDHSGLSLTDERVNFRREAQRFVSSIYLLLPVLIVMISVVIVSLNNIKKWELAVIIPFVVVLILLLLSFALLSRFYLDSFYIEKKRKDGVWYKVKEKELKWAGRLYGIYHDFVFLLRKTSNFKDGNTEKNSGKDDGTMIPDPPPDINIRNTHKRFTDQVESLETVKDFPREYIKEGDLAPAAFSDVTYLPESYEIIINPEYKRGKKKDKDGEETSDVTTEEFIKVKAEIGYHRWIYKNNPSFYKSLHLQVHVIAISSFVFMILISTGFLIPYEIIGSPGLICLSFACWLGIYTGLLYIDSRFKRNIKVSVRWLLVLWFFIVSIIDSDHPVRNNNDTGFSKYRPTLTEHFESWTMNFLADPSKDSIKVGQKIAVDSTGSKDSFCYPVYFITAEGGASRTGAFTAMLLARMQDLDSNFKKHIYAFSTVSGGSFGVGFFNAIAYLEPNNASKVGNYNEVVTEKFFRQDQLSPVLSKFFYGEILGNFWPKPVERFDRAIALEKAWEHSYQAVFNRPNDKNVFSTNFLSCYNNDIDKERIVPAWFINTTEVETGLQCFISNVRPASDRFLFSRQRDLLTEKIRYGINYSTAINFSSRFPLFSPSAALYQNDDQTYHYVDGGYIENTGSKTMLEIINFLKDSIRTKRILPYVIQLRFSQSDSSKFQKTGFLNEINSIVSGIYNVRAGSSAINVELLRREVAGLGGQCLEVPVPVSSKDVPMSWVFSKRSMNNLNNAIDTIMKDSLNDLHRLPYFAKKKKK